MDRMWKMYVLGLRIYRKRHSRPWPLHLGISQHVRREHGDHALIANVRSIPHRHFPAGGMLSAFQASPLMVRIDNCRIELDCLRNLFT